MKRPTMVGSIYSQGSEFWTTYLKGRAHIPDSIFQRIFTYHTQHGGQFDTVHDCGAGAAIHSLRIGQPFTKIIVSDPSEDNIRAAQTRVEGESKCEFHVAKLEDSASFLPPASVDMVFGATMLHFVDLPRAFDAIAYQLKPGGTFVALMVAMIEVEDEGVQTTMERVFNVAARRLIREGGDAMMPVIVTMGCMTEDVGLPETIFRPDSQRVFVNWTSGGPVYRSNTPPEFREEYPPRSGIGAKEEVIREEDQELCFVTDWAGLTDHLNTFPSVTDAREEMRELEELVGDRKLPARWSLNLILATRKQI